MDQSPMKDDPLAFFLTWTCYGTWLPGDERGWTRWHSGDQVPEPRLVVWSRKRMNEPPMILNEIQRSIVQKVVTEHCQLRNWQLHGVNCRTNHCHVVVTAANIRSEIVRDQLKTWSTRKLREDQRQRGIAELSLRKHWWSRLGSVRQIDDLDSLEAAIRYTLVAQDIGGSTPFK